MEAHDLGAALRRLSPLTVTGATTEAEAKASFAKLDDFGQGGIFLAKFSGQTPWERHRNGDELVHVLAGEVDLTVLTETEPVTLTLAAGSIFVVPLGLWHRQLARSPVTLLTATPQPTDLSHLDDPRSEPR